MLLCTWGCGVRMRGSQHLGLFWRWGSPGARRAVRFWSWGARKAQAQHLFPLDAQVPRDVLIFQHDRVRFFRLLGFFCAGQFVFWAYLAHFAFHTLRDTRAKGPDLDPQPGERPLQTLPAGASLNWGSYKWRYGFTASCLAVGSLILAAGFAFSRRSVSRVLLHRGGQEVTLTTYYPFALTSSFTVPLRHISCMSHRSEVPAMIPLKVKGKSFYFLLDKQGRITNAKLFDITVGAYRKL